MNQNQVLSFVRWLLTVGGSVAVGRGLLTADQLTWIGGAAAALIPLAWSMFVHTQAATVKSAADIVQIAPATQKAAGVKDPVLVPSKPVS